MARDYKHRVNKSSYSSNNRRQPRRKKASGSFWRLLLVAVLLVIFVLGLNMITEMVKELMAGKPELFTKPAEDKVKQEITVKQLPVAADSKNDEQTTAIAAAEPEEPYYEFFTILPQAEVVVPDFEIKTRVREELVGKTKSAKYVIQAGSFREASEAERHKAKLAQLGIESRVEAAKVNNVMWYRVNIGPYDNPSSVSTIKELLGKNGISMIVTEGSKQ